MRSKPSTSRITIALAAPYAYVPVMASLSLISYYSYRFKR